MDSLRDAARRLDAAAANLTDTASALDATRPTARDFGADTPGALGELGRALSGRWAAATDVRVRAAVAAAALLTETAAALRVAAESYTDTDDAARRRQAEER